MNRYVHTFVCECPNNGVKVSYTLTVVHADKVMVEEIIAACDVGIAFHEDLADALLVRLGGRQVMTAFHHGVWITTYRGDA